MKKQNIWIAVLVGIALVATALWFVNRSSGTEPPPVPAPKEQLSLPEATKQLEDAKAKWEAAKQASTPLVLADPDAPKQSGADWLKLCTGFEKCKFLSMIIDGRSIVDIDAKSGKASCANLTKPEILALADAIGRERPIEAKWKDTPPPGGYSAFRLQVQSEAPKGSTP